MSSTRHSYHVGQLLTLAEQKRYALAVSEAPDRWRLIGPDLRPATTPDGRTEFTAEEAKVFLAALPGS